MDSYYPPVDKAYDFVYEHMGLGLSKPGLLFAIQGPDQKEVVES